MTNVNVDEKSSKTAVGKSFPSNIAYEPGRVDNLLRKNEAQHQGKALTICVSLWMLVLFTSIPISSALSESENFAQICEGMARNTIRTPWIWEKEQTTQETGPKIFTVKVRGTAKKNPGDARKLYIRCDFDATSEPPKVTKYIVNNQVFSKTMASILLAQTVDPYSEYSLSDYTQYCVASPRMCDIAVQECKLAVFAVKLATSKAEKIELASRGSKVCEASGHTCNPASHNPQCRKYEKFGVK